jgi:hypothetical protein
MSRKESGFSGAMFTCFNLWNAASHSFATLDLSKKKQDDRQEMGGKKPPVLYIFTPIFLPSALGTRSGDILFLCVAFKTEAHLDQ